MARTPKTPKSTPADAPVVLPRTLAVGIGTVDPSVGKGKDVPLQDTTSVYLNRDVVSALRAESTVNGAVRALRRVSGDVSTAIAAAVHVANTPLQIVVKDAAHQIAPEGAALIKSLIVHLNQLSDYTYGFDDRQSIEGLTETLLQEVLLCGAVSTELVLDKARFPFALKPISPTLLKWKTSKTASGKNTTKIIPWIQTAGVTVDLDVPTLFYAELQKDPTTVYPRSPLETAITAALFQQDVIQDIRRVVRRSGHSRLQVVLSQEAVRKAAPIEVQADPVKMGAYFEEQRRAVEDQLAGLNPESALVFYNTVEAEYLNSEIGASADYGPLIEIVDGITSTALRTPTSILGKRMGGSQNVASTESLLFIKTASSIQLPVATVLSRAFTLAIRLLGFEGYCEVSFAPANMRPEEELEAFRQMRQQRVLELLSLGFLTDQEAAEMLGTGMRPAGAPPLSGTMFFGAKVGAEPPSPNGDPAKRALTGNAPRSAGGKDNTQR
jgi:hypothetical protein